MTAPSLPPETVALVELPATAEHMNAKLSHLIIQQVLTQKTLVRIEDLAMTAVAKAELTRAAASRTADTVMRREQLFTMGRTAHAMAAGLIGGLIGAAVLMSCIR